MFQLKFATPEISAFSYVFDVLIESFLEMTDCCLSGNFFLVASFPDHCLLFYIRVLVDVPCSGPKSLSIHPFNALIVLIAISLHFVSHIETC